MWLEEKKKIPVVQLCLNSPVISQSLHKHLTCLLNWGLPWWLRRQRICLQCRRLGFDPWVRKIPCRRERLPSLVSFPGEFHGQRHLRGYSPRGHRGLDVTERLTLPYSSWLLTHSSLLDVLLHNQGLRLQYLTG